MVQLLWSSHNTWTKSDLGCFGFFEKNSDVLWENVNYVLELIKIRKSESIFLANSRDCFGTKKFEGQHSKAYQWDEMCINLNE